MPPGSILIVGAGLAGARCAETLRAEGFEGELVLVGEEPFPPYERPALSKEFLAGERSVEDLLLRPRVVLVGPPNRACARRARGLDRFASRDCDDPSKDGLPLECAGPRDGSAAASASVPGTAGGPRPSDGRGSLGVA